MNNKSRFYALLLNIALFSACMKTYTLTDKVSKVPANPKVYKNRAMFTEALLSVVDTSVVYEELNASGKISRIYAGTYSGGFYSVYRFYGDGFLNEFFINKNADMNSELNPSHNGLRGVYCWKNGRIHYDLFASVSEMGYIGRHAGELVFSGDTLFVNERTPNERQEIYIKSKAFALYMQPKGQW